MTGLKPLKRILKIGDQLRLSGGGCSGRCWVTRIFDDKIIEYEVEGWFRVNNESNGRAVHLFKILKDSDKFEFIN